MPRRITHYAVQIIIGEATPPEERITQYVVQWAQLINPPPPPINMTHLVVQYIHQLDIPEQEGRILGPAVQVI